MSNPAPKRPKPKKQRQKAKEKKPPLSLWAIILGLATIVGVPAACVTFLPRVTATMSDPVDANNPFSSSITVTNTGYLPLNNVEVDLAPKFHLVGYNMDFGDCKKPGLHKIQWRPRNLGLDEKATYALSEAFFTPPQNLTSGGLCIVVEYELPIIHLKRDKGFPFYVKRETNGNIYWYAGFAPE